VTYEEYLGKKVLTNSVRKTWKICGLQIVSAAWNFNDCAGITLQFLVDFNGCARPLHSAGQRGYNKKWTLTPIVVVVKRAPGR
jgi:hypothetical protein